MSNKIPIVYILDNFYRGGGTENQLATLIENLDRDKFEPYVLNTRPQWPGKSIEINCEVTYLDLENTLSFGAIKTIKRVSDYLKEKKAQILHVFFLDSRIIGTLAGKLAKVNKIVYSRRDFGWWYTAKGLFIARRLASMSDFCVVNANAIKKLVAESEYFPLDKIEVIYNGVDFCPRPNAEVFSKGKFGIPEDAPVIGMVANLRPVKRIDRFISIAEKIKNKAAHFIMVGEGSLKERLQKEVSGAGLSDRFHFTHTVDGVYNMLQLFDIGILTSESEGLSNVLIEYALAGLPVVAYDTGGNSEIVFNGETGYILPDGEIDRFAEKIDILLEDKNLMTQYGNKAIEIARDRYLVETMVKKTEDFYMSILNKNRI